MATVKRFPGITIMDRNDENQMRVGDALVRIDHRMRKRHADRGMDQVGYISDTTQLTVMALQPHAPRTAFRIDLDQYRVTTPCGLDEATEMVGAIMPAVLAANRRGRRRDGLLGREPDERGDIVTLAAHWRFDPLFEPMARALGFDPTAPIRLAPSAYEAMPGMGHRIAETRIGGVVLDGLMHGDRIETCFNFDEGPLESFAMSPRTIDIHLREGFPDTIAHDLVGRPLSALLQIDGLPPSNLARRIEHVHIDETERLVGAWSKGFVRIGRRR